MNFNISGSQRTRPGNNLVGYAKKFDFMFKGWRSHQRILSRLMVDMILEGHSLNGEMEVETSWGTIK